MSYVIKLASFQDILSMCQLGIDEGWIFGKNDAAAFQLIDLQGFFVGYLDDQLISCISTVKYTSSFGFLGFYIVKSAYRGQGYGYKIWQHAMNYANQCNIGLDSVIAQQANYQKSGFTFAHKNIRCFTDQPIVNQPNPHILPAISLPFHEIAQYDRHCFPCDRSTFLASWLLMSNAVALVYYDNGIKGYGVIRECTQGYKIGPLFADNRHIATALFQALAQSAVKPGGIYLDIPDNNADAYLLAQEFNMKPVFETARMYTREAPVMASEKIFSITAFEVG